MGHSVEGHLAVRPEAYDAEIRRFVPGYEEMLEELTDALARLRAGGGAMHVVDLGAGSGALSQRVAERFERARVTLLDADAAMLERAKERLARYGDRIAFRQGSFFDALPEFDCAVASLALHHVHDREEKKRLYRNIASALPRDGFLLSADAMTPRTRALAERVMQGWAAHLVAHGDTEAQAYERFDAWAKEDRYFAIEEEIEMMRAGGFASVEVLWRRGPTAVIAAMRS